MKETIYEIYAYSVYGSDVIECDTLEQAEEKALDWSMNSIDTDIVIIKVEREKVKTFRNGGIVG